MSRLSQHCKNKKPPIGKYGAFNPPLNEWTKVCELAPYDTHIIRHFSVCKETFYAFLDKEYYKEEQGEFSAHLAAYKNGRNKTREKVNKKLLDLVDTGDVAATIFANKTYGGLIEAKDFKLIKLKKSELELKSKAFLTELAKKFDLNPDKLKEFTDAYFKPIDLD